jgi:hypothetical protein
MPKRVSLKGKGAELFFGDYPAASIAEPDAPPATTPLDGTPGEPAVSSDAARSEHAALASVADAQPAEPPAPSQAPRRAPRSPNTARPSPLEAARTLASVDAQSVEAIRQVIKVPGREVSYVRLTPEEKADLADVIYTYKRQGQKTSETEINRIALNYLLLDYRENGQQSVLARVLAALQA